MTFNGFDVIILTLTLTLVSSDVETSCVLLNSNLARLYENGAGSLLFEFPCVVFLDLCHDDPLSDLIEYISALGTLSNQGRLTERGDDIIEVIDQIATKPEKNGPRVELKVYNQDDGRWYTVFSNPGRVKGRGIGYILLKKMIAKEGSLAVLIKHKTPIHNIGAYRLIDLGVPQSRQKEGE